MSKGELGVLVLSGGQATRLGADRPKGTFPLGLDSPFGTLLEMQAAQIVRLKTMAKQLFPDSTPRLVWYVMVSKSTNKAISEHLDSLCETYGLPREDVVVFEQKEIPAFDFEGRRIEQKDGNVFMAPSKSRAGEKSCTDGNGGIYEALRDYLPELEGRGVKYMHIYCVDNILNRVGDPVFVGAAIKHGADCAAKVVEKRAPEEKVGVICYLDGRPTVVEYSELPAALAQRRTADGAKLLFRAGSIANHFLSVAFLREACALQLPYHIAKKKIPFFDRASQAEVRPSTENGVKLERFIFDVFSIAKWVRSSRTERRCRNFLVFQVERQEEFSPLKNPDSAGVDCLSTCVRDLRLLHSGWLRKAGLDAQAGLVDPRRSYEGEQLHSA